MTGTSFLQRRRSPQESQDSEAVKCVFHIGHIVPLRRSEAAGGEFQMFLDEEPQDWRINEGVHFDVLSSQYRREGRQPVRDWDAGIGQER